jgi:type IV pilus assembly protein PilV
LRNNQSSLERGVAVVETHAIADAMRADRLNAINGLFDLALADPDPAGMEFRNAVLRGWRQNLRNALGQEATGEVDCNGALCVITVQWDDERATLGDDTQQLRTTVQL